MRTSRRRSPGEETKSHCDLEHRGGFYSNSRHLTYALLLLLKSEIGERRRLVLRKERLQEMKIRQDREEEKARWGEGRREEADQDSGEQGGGEQGSGWRSSADLSVCLLFGICWSTQHDRFNLLIALCVCGNFSCFVCFCLCVHARYTRVSARPIASAFTVFCRYKIVLLLFLCPRVG